MKDEMEKASSEAKESAKRSKELVYIKDQKLLQLLQKKVQAQFQKLPTQ